MSFIKTLTCDGQNCKHIRMSDTNHWWWGAVTLKQITVGLMGDQVDLYEHEDWKHFCGEQCMGRWFQGEVTKLGGS